MAIAANNTIVLHDDRSLANIANFKTINGNAVLGAGDITPTIDIELIGIIRTNTATSRALTGLTLTSYNYLVFFLENVRFGSNGNRNLTLGQTTSDDVSICDGLTDTGSANLGMIQVFLQNGHSMGLATDTLTTTDEFLQPRGRQTALRRSSTTITFSNDSGDTFISGNIFVYGVFGGL